MAASTPETARLLAYDCLTPFGNVVATHHALCEGRSALKLQPVLGRRGGDLVPLALLGGRELDEAPKPYWLEGIRELASRIPGAGWGTPGRPIVVTSSNFGVGSLYSFRHDGGDSAHLDRGAPFSSVEWLRCELGWGEDITVFSHACVSAHLGLVHAARLLQHGLAEEVLVFSYDFLSPFVAGGFHALKILNGQFPAPYRCQETGSIALGDGAAFAVLTRDRGDFCLEAQSLYNELHHFTANKADGSGFAAVLEGLRQGAGGRRLWLKGHGTGTLEAGRLEAESLARVFPGAPLVGWKGSLGHTLGTCGLVELAISAQSLRDGRAPGTIGTQGPCFIDTVATEAFSLAAFDAVLCSSNAFGGAHAALLLAHA